MNRIDWCAWIWLGAVLGGCYGSSGNTKEGQSHWLTRCASSNDCGDDLACACGVCTIACDGDTSCGETGTCVSVGDEPSCADAPREMSDVCLAACTNDDDCELSSLVCSAGSCVAAPQEGDEPALVNGCEQPGAFAPLEPTGGEACYELVAHNGDALSADPFMVNPDESLNQFYYEIPWPAGSVATRFGTVLDNVAVLRQWLLFSIANGTPGTVSRNVTGTTLFEDSRVLAGWGKGGCNVTLPSDMGLALPDPGSGRVLMVQWHHLNSTDEPQPDASKVQICVVPRRERSNTGGVTVLGTENLGNPGMAPNAESKFSGTCLNEASEPVTVVALRPAMRALGMHMHSDVERANGDVAPVFDEPFTYESQAHYLKDPFVVLQPGDRLRSECTYFNDTAQPVPFGQSVASEICFQYAYAYPDGALDKPDAVSLIGSLNTCWGD